jgi:predicted transcriptional regulator
MPSDDEYLFWSEIEALQERLKRLEMPQETMINRAAQTLLNLKESWQEATQEEQRELVQIMLQEVACSIQEQQVTWVKPQPVFEILFKLVNDLPPDEKGRFFLKITNRNMEQMGTED